MLKLPKTAQWYLFCFQLFCMAHLSYFVWLTLCAAEFDSFFSSAFFAYSRESYVSCFFSSAEVLPSWARSRDDRASRHNNSASSLVRNRNTDVLKQSGKQSKKEFFKVYLKWVIGQQWIICPAMHNPKVTNSKWKPTIIDCLTIPLFCHSGLQSKHICRKGFCFLRKKMQI